MLREPTRNRIARSAIALIGVSCVLVVCVQVASAISGSASPLRVKTIIWPNFIVTFSAKVLKRGSVVFEIQNRYRSPQQFAIDGSESALMAPGASATLKVKFVRRGLYAFTLPDYQENTENGYKQVGGSVKVD